jgi:hypothetical protein
MNATKNLVLFICFTFNLGHYENSLFINPSVSLLPEETFTNQTNWELVKNHDGIKVYSQWVTLYDGFKTRRLRGNFQVNVPLPNVLAILKDGGKVKNWMEGVTESYTITSENNLWYSYAKFNIPWPFDDQDLIVENILDFGECDDTAFIYLKGCPELLPVNPEYKRMESFYGYWMITKISAYESRVEYAAYSRSKPIVPRFVQDPIVQNTFMTSLNNLATYCQSSK